MEFEMNHQQVFFINRGFQSSRKKTIDTFNQGTEQLIN